MRIVIVEDENKTRNGLHHIIEKYTSYEVVACESNGADGFEAICRLQPDMVITDIRMPVMSGLEMLEKLREKGMTTRVVLLTGYSDFEYARKSIQLMAEDYLLKPLNVEDILEVLDRINEKDQQTKMMQVSEEQLLFSALTQEEAESTICINRLEQRLHIQAGDCISLFLLKNCSVIPESLNEMISLLEGRLPDICLSNYHIFHMPDRQHVLVVLLNCSNIEYIKKVFQMNICPSLYDIGECMMVHREVDSLYNLKQVLLQMQDDFKYGFATEKYQILDQKFIASCKFDVITYPETLEQNLRKEIRDRNMEKAKKIAQCFSERIINGNGKPEYRKDYTVRFLLFAIQITQTIKGTKEIEYLGHSMLEKIMQCDTKDRLQYEYEKIMNQLLREENESESADNGLILNVIEYIRLNYAKDISLSGVAEVVGITPEYLSKLFAKEMGTNFSTFLRNFRIRTAKNLLTDDKYKIYEVAEAVGFNDTKYFNKVFKSVVGISPSAFRKEIQ